MEWAALLAIFFAVACYYVAQAKGYRASWGCVWGLLFGIFALIVYAILPDRTKGEK